MAITKTKAPPGAIPFDPDEGCSHPPCPDPKTNPTIAADIRPAMRWMRGAMVQELVTRMKRRRKGNAAGSAVRSRTGLRRPMRKRKAAMALSAAVMSMSTGASLQPPDKSALVQLELDPTKTRVAVSRLTVSEAMKEALAEEEGVRLTVYRDVAGYPTVGVGHLVRPADGLRVGDTITYERALDFLKQDLRTAEQGVRKLVGTLPLYQHEFDALVDLVYNVGIGNVSENESPGLNAAIDARDYAGIAEQLNYHHAAGAKANGLVYRSERRQAIFMDAAYDDPRAHEVSKAGQVSA